MTDDQYKPFDKSDDEWILKTVFLNYKHKLEKISEDELFKNTILLPQYEEKIKKSIKFLSDMIGYIVNGDLDEINSRKDILYPYVCNAIKFYKHELLKNNTNIQELLGENLPNTNKIKNEIKKLGELEKQFCKESVTSSQTF